MITTVLFSPDGKYIATQSNDLTTRIWSTETGTCLHTLQDPNYGIRAIAFSPDSKSMATTPFGRGGIRLWDITTGAVVHSIDVEHQDMDTITFSPHGRYIACNNWRTLYLYDINTGKCLHALRAKEDQVIFFSPNFSPNNKHLVTESYNFKNMSRTLRIWDISTGTCIHTFAHHKGISLSPDGNTLVTVQQEWKGEYFREKNARIIDINTGHCIKTLEIPEKNIISASLSHDGHHIVTLEGSGNVKARIWDAHTGQCLHALNVGKFFNEHSIEFSPNDKHIVASISCYRKTQVFKSSFNIKKLTLEQTKFITLCEAATVENKMPLWVIARRLRLDVETQKKLGLDINALRTTFYSFDDSTQKLMRKTYGLSDIPDKQSISSSALPQTALPDAPTSSPTIWQQTLQAYKSSAAISLNTYSNSSSSSSSRSSSSPHSSSSTSSASSSSSSLFAGSTSSSSISIIISSCSSSSPHMPSFSLSSNTPPNAAIPPAPAPSPASWQQTLQKYKWPLIASGAAIVGGSVGYYYWKKT